MQPSFSDHQDQLELLEQLGDPLPKLERTVDWEAFRVLLGSVYKNSGPRKGGRPLYDVILMFKVNYSICSICPVIKQSSKFGIAIAFVVFLC